MPRRGGVVRFRAGKFTLSSIPLVAAGGVMVGTGGLEPPTSCVSSKRSPPELRPYMLQSR